MSKDKGSAIIIDDIDNRCDWIFPEILERCWLMSSKTFSYDGEIRGKFCQFHYEVGLQLVAAEVARERIAVAGVEKEEEKQ
jgi:hypothetical protein